jgi:hypothetical protein
MNQMGWSRGVCRLWFGVSACALAPVACQSAGSPAAVRQAEPERSDLPRAITLALDATPDSALKLAKLALGSIEGVVQLPKVRPQLVTVANHLLRNRDGGGQTQIAVIAALDRQVVDTARPVTMMELSVWVLDMPHQLSPAQRRAGVPSTPLTTNTPAFKQPRAMTPADTTYWRTLEDVVASMIQHGARRVP